MPDEFLPAIYYNDSAFACGRTKSTNEGNICSVYINITLA